LLKDILDWVQQKAQKLGAESFDAIATEVTEGQARFSNNSLTIVNNVRASSVSVYLTKGKKRVFGVISSPKREVVENLIERLYSSMMTGVADTQFAPLPAGPFDYTRNNDIEQSVEDFNHAYYAQMCIDSALSAGASRVAGSLVSQHTLVSLRTSTGVEAQDERTGFTLNVRAFTDRDASGHGLAVATRLKDFDVESAGRVAGERAARSRSPKQVEQGTYSVIFGRTVFSNLVEIVGDSASAYNIDSGLSFLPERLSESVASESFTLIDHGQVEGGVDSRSFDDEGIPTGHTRIIDRGLLVSHLHNSTTAAKWNTRTTGNAGLIQPRAWNLEVLVGDSSIDEMIRETKRGVYVTNNWYTRFQSYKTGDYSTLPRDYAFYIEGGELKYPVTGFRISDSIPRQLRSIRLIGRERSWVKWWEVRTPTLCPDVLIDGVTLTRATS
jgi:PmbA protein